jgi:uncharacterized protein YjiS (DUF1127 family)
MLSRLITKINRKITQYLMYQRTIGELERLSNRDLADLGIARCDIPFIAASSTRYRAR